MKTGRNEQCPCGSGKKYKKCCMEKKENIAKLNKRAMTITRRDFISEPYKKCPNPKCLSDDSFGVSFLMGGSKHYTRECVKCGYQQNFNFPIIKKKIIYLDHL
ncbi:MAG: SEC-C metal-binding domain-containing protein [Candidatus Paceibacterota bacterium]|jgi:Zn ribbon nucleic-acid-binding protein